MGDEEVEDLEVLAVEVGKVRSACLLLQVVAEALETGGSGDRSGRWSCTRAWGSSEPPRDCRRPKSLRGYGHGQWKQVFP